VIRKLNWFFSDENEVVIRNEQELEESWFIWEILFDNTIIISSDQNDNLCPDGYVTINKNKIIMAPENYDYLNYGGVETLQNQLSEAIDKKRRLGKIIMI